MFIWIYAVNNINTDGVELRVLLCWRAWIPGVCKLSPYPTCKPITSEFNSIMFEYVSFGSLLAHLFLKPYPSLSFIFFVLAWAEPRRSIPHRSHGGAFARIITWCCLLASARFLGIVRGPGAFIHLPCPRCLSLKLVRVPVRVFFFTFYSSQFISFRYFP